MKQKYKFFPSTYETFSIVHYILDQKEQTQNEKKTSTNLKVLKQNIVHVWL